jgi:hypothetical protein
VVPANNTTSAGPPVASSVVISGAAVAFAPLKSSEALLAGGGGGGQSSPATVTNSGPPMPSNVRTSDIALMAFTSQTGGGGDEVVQGMLMKLADVEEPQLLAVEYGDEVVKHEVTVNKKIVPPPADQPASNQMAAVSVPKIVADAVTPPVDHTAAFAWRSYWWLMLIPAGGTVAAWWIYRQRAGGNVGALLRRLGL